MINDPYTMMQDYGLEPRVKCFVIANYGDDNPAPSPLRRARTSQSAKAQHDLITILAQCCIPTLVARICRER